MAVMPIPVVLVLGKMVSLRSSEKFLHCYETCWAEDVSLIQLISYSWREERGRKKTTTLSVTEEAQASEGIANGLKVNIERCSAFVSTPDACLYCGQDGFLFCILIVIILPLSMVHCGPEVLSPC